MWETAFPHFFLFCGEKGEINMSVEGAMLGGSFLPEKEFKELMLLLWQEKN